MFIIKEDNTYSLSISESKNGIRNGWSIECEAEGRIDKMNGDEDIVVCYNDAIYYFEDVYWGINGEDGIGIGKNVRYRFHCADYKKFEQREDFIKELI